MLHMIGIDLVFIPEFKDQVELGGSKFLEKAFSISELQDKKSEHLAGLWAAKEAIIKAAKTTPKKYTEIIISHDTSGKPQARIGSQQFAISISHHGDYAIAVAHRLQE
jgi:phosphopantetheine--protein transferase-like protein